MSRRKIKIIIFNKLFKCKLVRSFVLSLSSFSPGLILFLLTVNLFPSLHDGWSNIIKFVVLAMVTTIFSLWIIRYLPDSEDTMLVENIQPIENEAIPTYLGLFIIMLSLGAVNLIYQALIFITIFLIWWLFMERSHYFNIIWLICYRYYKVQDNHGNTYGIYSKRKDLKLQNSQLKLTKLVRVNNFTFIERKYR